MAADLPKDKKTTIQWTEEAKDYLLLATFQTLREERIKIPWDEIAKKFSSTTRGGLIAQTLGRIRQSRLRSGQLVPPGPYLDPHDPSVKTADGVEDADQNSATKSRAKNECTTRPKRPVRKAVKKRKKSYNDSSEIDYSDKYPSDDQGSESSTPSIFLLKETPSGVCENSKNSSPRWQGRESAKVEGEGSADSAECLKSKVVTLYLKPELLKAKLSSEVSIAEQIDDEKSAKITTVKTGIAADLVTNAPTKIAESDVDLHNDVTNAPSSKEFNAQQSMQNQLIWPSSCQPDLVDLNCHDHYFQFMNDQSSNQMTSVSPSQIWTALDDSAMTNSDWLEQHLETPFSEFIDMNMLTHNGFGI